MVGGTVGLRFLSEDGLDHRKLQLGMIFVSISAGLRQWKTICEYWENHDSLLQWRGGELASLSWGERRPVPHDLLLVRRSPVPSHPGKASER